VAVDSILVQNNTNDTTLAMIDVGDTRAYSGIYTVPVGKTFYLNHFSASTASAVLTNVSIWYRVYDSGVWLEEDAGMVWLSDFNNPRPMLGKFAAKTDIEIRAKGNTGSVIAKISGWYE